MRMIMQAAVMQNAAVTQAGSDPEILQELNRNYIRAVRESDVRWFEANLADDFMNSNPDGSLVSGLSGRGAGFASPPTSATAEAWRQPRASVVAL